jgi:hypothetical protein
LNDPSRPVTESRKRFYGAGLAALLLFAAAYSNSLRNSFHFDDSHVVEQNLFIRDLANVPRFFRDARTFSSAPQNTVYRPVVTLTLAIDYWMGHGLDPLAFHITQLTLFALIGVMLVFLYLRLFETTGEQLWHKWAALFAATLYCVHTGNTQPANYISARSELLSALGVVGGFIVYLYAPRITRSRSRPCSSRTSCSSKNGCRSARSSRRETGVASRDRCSPRCPRSSFRRCCSASWRG